MMDFRMDTFITVCSYMNFTKAASKLNITQPAVSQHIRYLEEAYGCRLFEQKGKRISLTKSGELLLSAARTMKHDEQQLVRAMRETDREKRYLNFGATLTVGEYLIPQRVADYIQKSAPIPITMLVENTTVLLKFLNEGKIDFAIVEGYFSKKEYDYHVFQRESYIPVCAAKHTFQSEPRYIEDLLGENLIVRERESGNREILERYLEGRNLSLEDFANRMEISDIRAIKVLVERDCGIAFLYRASVERELREGRMKRIPLREFEIHHDINFIWRKGSIYGDYYNRLYQELSGEEKAGR